MYGHPPIFLEPTSNREDLLRTISIWDDDTGDPINLSYTVTASGLPFSGTTWSIISGEIAIDYIGPLTIPAPPIGNELSAFTIPIGIDFDGLLVPGNPVKIQDPTGTNYMLGTITSYNNTNGILVSQIGNTFQFEIRRQAPRNGDIMWGGYTPWANFGTLDNEGPLIMAALGTGLTIVDIGVLQILIPELTMRKLQLTTYGAYLTMTDGVSVRQVMIANLPVLYGGVTQ